MKNRDAVLLYQKSEADTAVEIIDLKFSDPVSALNIEVECTNGTSGNKGNWISDIVTKVEVVDGSNALASLNMFALEYQHWLKTRQSPGLYPSEWVSDVTRHNATLFFGRRLWDPDYALNTTVFSNPQLKVTFNKAAIRAAGVSGFADAVNIKLTAVAKVMEGMPAPGQFLMQKQINSFTPATTGEYRVDLPMDYPYRLLLLRAYLSGYETNEVISDLKITCDTDTFIPINRKVKQLSTEARGLLGMAAIRHHIYTHNNEVVRTMFDKGYNFSVHPWAGATQYLCGPTAASANNFTMEVHDASGATISSDKAYVLSLNGHNLHATVPVIFGELDTPGTWFNPANYKKFEAVLTQAVASGTVEIVAEQVRPNTKV